MTLPCACPGRPEINRQPCPANATQEDALCDWCRALDCPTLTTANELARIRSEAARQVLETVWRLPERRRT